MVFLVISILAAVYFFITLSEDLYPQYDVITDPNEISIVDRLPSWIKIVREGEQNKLVDEKNDFKIRINENWSIFSADANTISIGLFNTERQSVQQGFKVGIYKDDSAASLAIWVRNWTIKSNCPVCYSAPRKLEDNLYNVIHKEGEAQRPSYFFRKNGQIYEISIFDSSLDIKQILNYFEFVTSSATTTP